ncbi:MAG: hypothetical protein ACYC2Y_06295 [Armatimonadota bacterium]
MSTRLITMLTYNDETVKDAFEVFEECADLPCEFWGFKDIGLSTDRMRLLVEKMKDSDKTTFLEVVSLTEQECIDGAKVALDCGFDYLMGTVFYPSVFEFLKDKTIKFMPFCGKVSGHPSILDGSVQETIDEAKKMEALGVDGFDLLAYRYIGDAEELTRQLIANINVPLVMAGSIDSFERLSKVKELNPWAFTIGSAFFDKKFVKDAPFKEQLASVLAYIGQEELTLEGKER